MSLNAEAKPRSLCASSTTSGGVPTTAEARTESLPSCFQEVYFMWTGVTMTQHGIFKPARPPQFFVGV